MYVNYGMVEDFKKLREMNISVKGHIVIAKYGKIYRGDKVSFFTGSEFLLTSVSINEVSEKDSLFFFLLDLIIQLGFFALSEC